MSSSDQGSLREPRVTPAMFRPVLNPWPPFRRAGIRVTRDSDDHREVDAVLGFGRLESN